MKSLVLLAVVALAGLSARAVLQPPAPRAVWAAAPEPAATAEARGARLYADYGCGLCHGADGAGGFANPNAETEGKVPAVIYVAEGYTRRELAQLIRSGTPRIGRHDPAGPAPPFRMPGWGDRMTAQDIDDLATYLMSLYPNDAGSSWR